MQSESEIAALSVDASKEILKYTPQLFRKFGNTQPVPIEAWATGVLLMIEEVKFLISAAHVLEENKKPINPEDVGIMIGDTFHILNGFIKYAATGLHPNNEKVDLTVWRLDDPDVVADLEKKYRFLCWDQLDVEHNPVTTSNYLMVGFPVTRTKKKPQAKKLKVEPFIFLSKLGESRLYKKVGVEDHSHFIVKYRKRKIKDFNGKIIIGPDPFGMSGCGLWHVPVLQRNDQNEVPSRLVAILHEWRKEESLLIATRIHIVTEVIRKAFDLSLPASRKTKVNLGDG